MASIITTGANAALLLRQHFDAELMETLERELIVADLMTQKVLPTNSGVTVQFHRIQNFPHQTTAITQSMGSAHTAIFTTGGQLKGDTYVVDSVPATLELIGNDLQLSELLMITSEPNPVPEVSSRFMYGGAATIDQKCLNLMVCSNANGASNTATAPSINYNGASVSVTVVWGDGSATLTEATLDADNVTHLIAAESFNRATGELRANRAKPHPKCGGCYAGIVSPQQATNLRLDGTFQEVALKNYQRGEEKFENATIGRVFGVQVMESAAVAVNFPGTIDATNDEIHRGIVFGDGYAHKVSHAKGVGRPRVSFVPPTPSAGDVYGNNGYLAWKAYFAGTVVNPVAGVILKNATTYGTASSGGDDGEWE